MSQKYSFANDYSEGAHPNILEALMRTNNEQAPGYGHDHFTEEATMLLKEKIENPEADIHFVSGGTQANIIVLAALLRPYESIIAPVSGHINVHEAGAIEATGHKIHGVPSTDGKLTPEGIQGVLDEHTDEHMVTPRIVFISQATEVGTIYSKIELEALSAFCKSHELFLYCDGARLGSALMSPHADITLSVLSALVDAFYIGGTKNGALLGEAIVINHPRIKENFRYHLKQRGALLAKGRLLGIQFLELFRNDLYFTLAQHANKMAAKLTEGLKAQGFPFLTNSSTNQIFPIFPKTLIEPLKTQYGFYVWAPVDEKHDALRLVTSWTTPESAVDQFLADVRTLMQ